MKIGRSKLGLNEGCPGTSTTTPPLQKAKSYKFKIHTGSIKEHHLIGTINNSFQVLSLRIIYSTKPKFMPAFQVHVSKQHVYEPKEWVEEKLTFILVLLGLIYSLKSV